MGELKEITGTEPDELAGEDDGSESLESVDLEELRAQINRTGVEDSDAPAPKSKSAKARSASETAEAEPDEETEGSEDEDAEGEEEEEEDDDLSALSPNLRHRFEILEARARHFERVAGRYSGESGHLKKQIQQQNELLQGLVERLERSEFEGDDDGEPRARRRQDRSPEPVGESRLLNWAVNRALSDATSEFAGAHPDVTVEGLNFMTEYCAHRVAQSPIDKSDPDLAAAQTSEILEEAYLALLERSGPRRNGARPKARQGRNVATAESFDQADELVRRKRARQVSRGTGGPKPKPFDPETAPLDDLKKIINKLGVPSLG